MPDCQETSIIPSAQTVQNSVNNQQITGLANGANNTSAAEAEHFPYLPHTQEDRLEMLAQIGIRSFEELIKHIPAHLQAKPLALPNKMSELELVEAVSKLAKKNKPASAQSCFLGGGSYRRFVPAIVPAIVSRSEFATSYTPYQAEVSQGNLQSIYEFQTAVCLLTNMDVANASMYDGPTACAEAALMASRLTGKQKIILSNTLNPEYLSVVSTYINSCGLVLDKLPSDEGSTKISTIDDETAAVIIQYPNYFGVIEDLKKIEKAVHDAGALLIFVCDPISLGYLAPPGDFAADIVVGDAQACGNFLSFGGPSAGFIACRTAYVRQLPGRLAGKTVDSRGLTAFTLTLQAREQHIRRSKATSNICTNQALNALSMLVYLSALGPQGLKSIAYASMQKAHYLASELTKISGVSLAFNKPFFSEFAIVTAKPAKELLNKLTAENILGGLDLTDANLNNGILISTTEMNHKEELDNYVAVLKKLLS
jgi:glycine dehydrogenase subunit 1